MDYEDFVKAAQANVDVVASRAADGARKHCANELDIIGRMNELMCEVDAAKDENDLNSFREAMAQIAAYAIAQAAMAEVPGCVLS